MHAFSEEHKAFIKNIERKERIVKYTRILLLVLFLIIWEALVRFNYINPFLYSSPSNVYLTIVSLVNNNSLFKHIGVTVFEVLISFSLSSLLGIIFASLLWYNNTLYRVLDPYLTVMNSLPKVALGPLIIIWCGANPGSIVFLSLLISVFISILSIFNAFSSVNSNQITMMKSFGANKFQIYKKLILPSNILNIISTLKINISMSLIGVIMGELLVSKSGVGYLINYGSQIFNLNLVVTGIFVLGVISFVLYKIIDIIEIKYKSLYN